MLALKSTNKTLEAHTSIDYIHTKWFEVTVSLTLELHEYDVPYLDNLWIVLIDELTSRHLCLLFWCTRVEVNLGARTTRTSIAHLPEVIVLVTIDDVVSRNMLEPVAISLLVACKTFAIITFEDSNVEVCRIKLENINEILPCHINSTFLEVVTERPVAEHLEHCMVICIVSNLFEVVVLTTNTETLLRVRTATWLWVACTEDYILPLVHTSIGKH